MAITYQKETKLITIHTANTTYQMMVDQYGFLLHLYYGKRMQGDARHLVQCLDRGFSGNLSDDRSHSLDYLPQEYPTLGTGDFRSPALNIKNADDSESCRLTFKSCNILDGKYTLPGLPAVYADKGAQTLEIILEDVVNGIQVKLLYGVLEKEDIITRSAIIINNSNQVITIEKAGSACLDLLYGDYDLISFYGKHNLERQFERNSIKHSNMVIGSTRGTSSHQYNPGVIIADKRTTETAGDCYGFLFVYSGNFMLEAGKDQYGTTRVIMGLQDELFHYELDSNLEFVVPETILTFSDAGFSGLSNTYHSCIRDHICRGNYGKSLPPVVINSWEAAYFDFSGDTILKLAENAAQLGIDMVVMDDGWFGKRNDDNSSLGDWVVNEEKLGLRLGELIEKINAKGVKFGIWMEPEMISEDSDLFRKHPDWAIQIPGRDPVRGRNQLVLDFSRQEVRDYIFDRICNVLDQGNIEYIKWDMNRSITDVYSSKTNQGNVIYDYYLGLYNFLEKLKKRYPDILIEGCSGGGGRFDAGMLYYTPQIWCSDNTDAINRLKIQYGTSFFYPLSTMGAHVSAVPNHQTGRSVSLNTRGIVAMTGAFGYEMDPGKLSETQREEIKCQISTYKKLAPLISQGDYYRLSDPDQEDYVAWEIVSKDKTKVLLNVVYTDCYGNPEIFYVRLMGLDSQREYMDEETGRYFSGSVLMNVGINLPLVRGDYEGYQMLFVAK